MHFLHNLCMGHVNTWNHELAKKRLRELGMRRDWVAKQLGVAYATLNGILGGRKPSNPTLILFAQLLEVPIEDLKAPARKAS